MIEDALMLRASSGAVVAEVCYRLLHHRKREHLLTASLDCPMPNVVELPRSDVTGGEDVVDHVDAPNLAALFPQLLYATAILTALASGRFAIVTSSTPSLYVALIASWPVSPGSRKCR